jgi:hypothetical protein
MAVDTTKPLPPGRYWIDLIGAERIAKFGGGVKGLNEAHPGLVRVISATRHLQNEARDYAESPDLTGVLVALWETVVGNIQDTPERDWVLFEVTAPAIWDFEAMGTPTVAPAWVKSESDTVQRPAPEPDITTEILDWEHGLASTAKKAVVGTGVIVVLGIVSYLVITKVMARKAG